MQRDSGRQGEEEDAWRAIVENYGERPTLDDEPEQTGPTLETRFVVQPNPAVPVEPPAVDADDVDDDRFVPPTPPPLPTVSRDRLAAWAGLFGAPAVLLVCVVAGVHLPGLLAYALVGAFVGGFLYLVVTMPSGPADPWDDGARL